VGEKRWIPALGNDCRHSVKVAPGQKKNLVRPCTMYSAHARCTIERQSLIQDDSSITSKSTAQCEADLLPRVHSRPAPTRVNATLWRDAEVLLDPSDFEEHGRSALAFANLNERSCAVAYSPASFLPLSAAFAGPAPRRRCIVTSTFLQFAVIPSAAPGPWIIIFTT